MDIPGVSVPSAGQAGNATTSSRASFTIPHSSHNMVDGPTPEQVALFEEFERYQFSNDPDFKAGLPTVIGAIRGMKRSASQIDEMIGRAQWFYFTRLKNVAVPWESYASYSTDFSTSLSPPSTSASASVSSSNSSVSRSPTPLTTQANKPRPKEALATLNNLAEAKRMMADGGSGQRDVSGENGMSFGMLCKLISEGRAGEVPVKHIPDQLNSQPPSDSMLPPRQKPWEQRPSSASSASHSSFCQSHPSSPQNPTTGILSQQKHSISTPSLHPSPPGLDSLSLLQRESPQIPAQPIQSYPVYPYRQNSTKSNHSSQSPDLLSLGASLGTSAGSQEHHDHTKKFPSPPGTSKSFTNPSLAPSPPLQPSPLSPNGDPFDYMSALPPSSKSSSTSPFDARRGAVLPGTTSIPGTTNVSSPSEFSFEDLAVGMGINLNDPISGGVVGSDSVDQSNSNSNALFQNDISAFSYPTPGAAFLDTSSAAGNTDDSGPGLGGSTGGTLELDQDAKDRMKKHLEEFWLAPPDPNTR